MTDNDEPTTREERLTNNRLIVEQEGGTPAEVFINEIETRLALPLEIRNESDERLGDAYIACLNDQEARGESDYNPFLRLMPEDLVIDYGVTRIESAVVYFMAAMEYVNIP